VLGAATHIFHLTALWHLTSGIITGQFRSSQIQTYGKEEKVMDEQLNNSRLAPITDIGRKNMHQYNHLTQLIEFKHSIKKKKA